MEQLRNLPSDPAALLGLIDYQPGSVVSMALSRSEHVAVTLFAFDEGDGVSEEFYPGDTLYLLLEGEMPLRRGGASALLRAGDCVRVPAGQAHAVGGQGRFKLLQLTLIPD